MKSKAKDKASKEHSPPNSRRDIESKINFPVTFTDNIVLNAKLAISRYEFPLISGPVGCGKSSFVDYLSFQCGSPTIRIQISEQTDAKALVGAYCCTEIPGQFIWRAGPLTKALVDGKWLILEDIDRGSPELLTLLCPLLSSSSEPCKNLPSTLRDPVSGSLFTRHENFRIIMTRRLAIGHNEFRPDRENALFDIIERQSYPILLSPLCQADHRLILTQQYPTITPLIERILLIFEIVQSTKPITSSFRPVTVRDLIKLGGRISRLDLTEAHLSSSSIGHKLLLHAHDCFLASSGDASTKFTIFNQIAALLNLSEQKAAALLYNRPINQRILPDQDLVCIGDASLSRRSSNIDSDCNPTSSIMSPTSSRKTSQHHCFASTRSAMVLLEQMAHCLTSNQEPVLLVGETGTGKTSTVQHLADLTGNQLRVINLNQQSDSVDLMGGFKPVDLRSLVRPVRERFESLFCRTFKMEENLTFLSHINDCFTHGHWNDLVALMTHPTELAIQQRSSPSNEHTSTDQTASLLHQDWTDLAGQLGRLRNRLDAIARQGGGSTASAALFFDFVEGALVRAIRAGEWVLLDEVNLAPPELFDCLAGLLDSHSDNIIVSDQGDDQPLIKHNNFRLFAAMNPSTDVGKRDLPVGLRNRFTELYVGELDPGLDQQPDTTSSSMALANDKQDLVTLIGAYLQASLSPNSSQLALLVRLYAALRQAALDGLIDGVGQRPHFSLRTLCRALAEAGRGYHGNLVRSLYEGFMFSFGSQICRSSRPILDTLVRRHLALLKQLDETALSSLLNRPLPKPSSTSSESSSFINVEGYWLHVPPSALNESETTASDSYRYILTPTVRANLKDLARVVAAGGSLPVLLQGETSVGKTSLIVYLADRCHQTCLRINNHEHTDVQTYLGSYTVDSASSQINSKTTSSPPLVFKDGPLVQAMRNGHWLILDELNLAPSDILEALNRVLDDNRSVFIPETQEVVKAHPMFRLFATQNPAGLYAGRKVLSRALRNRFIELHFDPLPREELEVILEKRCDLAPSRAKRLVEVMHRLQLARAQSNLFQGRDSFMTLRDLFRWAERYRLANFDGGQEVRQQGQPLFDWDAYLADQGYLLLAGRVRSEAEAKTVANAIETVFRRPIDRSSLFSLSSQSLVTSSNEFIQSILSSNNETQSDFDHVVWTNEMRRLLILIGNALKFGEPVLLVGETGCGKTTICQLLAAFNKVKLYCVNCHQFTEASDFLGGLRPVRRSSVENTSNSQTITGSNQLFEWINGPLVSALLEGNWFLLDELSLADDAVLERLNSLLEPGRQLVLTECAGSDSEAIPTTITAQPSFRLLATMNPGGDYGKKELSPALRNRFTEIWCPAPLTVSLDYPTTASTVDDSSSEIESTFADLCQIVRHNLQLRLLSPTNQASSSFSDELANRLASVMVEFVVWFGCKQKSAEYAAGSTGSGNCHRPPPTIRDLIAWLRFMERVCCHTSDSANDEDRLSLFSACLHGASLVFLDAIEDYSGSVGDISLTSQAITFLADRLRSLQAKFAGHLEGSIGNNMFDPTCLSLTTRSVGLSDDRLWFGTDEFRISTGPELKPTITPASSFIFAAPTPAINVFRLLRAMQLAQRAILLEGSPGVGKTALVSALGAASGHPVIRINLSEATEASDLIGCDLPIEGAGAGKFAWRDGPLLQALRLGHWVLLDEMNLASQSVLECLNACLDHRGELYIPELGATFHIKPQTTRLFACQNPLQQGGGRKGLPKSFLNRFTQVYLSPLTASDQTFILHQLYPNQLPESTIDLMVAFNELLNKRINNKHEFANLGSPWEFNLRDLLRWCDLLTSGQKSLSSLNPGLYVHLLYTARMRTIDDQLKLIALWNEVCVGHKCPHSTAYYHPCGRPCLYNGQLHFGFACNPLVTPHPSPEAPILLDQHRTGVELLFKVIEMGWMAILVGPPGAGKRTIAHLCSLLLNQRLITMTLSPSSDTVDLLGSLEQQSQGGRFHWVDSPLVEAVQHGHWVLLENAQLCSPSLLDRLNSLLEPNGQLVLNERGPDSRGRLPLVKPHTNFRLILTVDEDRGFAGDSISRALRNRGIEIVLHNELSSIDCSNGQFDLDRLFVSQSLPLQLTRALLDFHTIYAQVYHSSSSSSSTTTDDATSPQLPSLPPAATAFKRIGVNHLLSMARACKQLLDVNNHQLDGEFLSHLLTTAYASVQLNQTCKTYVKQIIAVYISTLFASPDSVIDLESHSLPWLMHDAASILVEVGSPAYINRHLRALELALNSSSSARPSLVSRLLREQLDSSPAAKQLSNIDHLSPSIEQTADMSSFATHFELIPPSDDGDIVASTKGPDLRWFIGWCDLIDSESETTWNRRFVHQLVAQLTHDVFMSCSALISLGRDQIVRKRLCPNSSLRAFAQQLNTLESALLVKSGQLPADLFASNYPGLDRIASQWSSHLARLTRDFVQHGCWSKLVKAFFGLTNWLTLFLTDYKGNSDDWPDRLAFHNELVELRMDRNPIVSFNYQLIEQFGRVQLQACLIKVDQLMQLPSPARGDSLLTIDWSSLGRLAGLVCANLQATSGSGDEGVNDDDIDELEEEGTVDCTSSSLSNFSNIPLLAIVALLTVANNNARLSPDLLRASAKSLFGCLQRPRLMTFIGLSQFKRLKSTVAAELKSTVGKVDSSEDKNQHVNTLYSTFSRHIDLSVTSRLFGHLGQSIEGLEQINPLTRCRSLLQASHALVWPMLVRRGSQYQGTDHSSPPSCSLVGWHCRRQVLRKTSHLLLLASSPSYSVDPTSPQPLSTQQAMSKSTTATSIKQMTMLATNTFTSLNHLFTNLLEELPVDSSISSSSLNYLVDALQSKLDQVSSIEPQGKDLANLWNQLLGLTKASLSTWKGCRKGERTVYTALCQAQLGCLTMLLTCPRNRLDPCHVHELDCQAVDSELSRINQELQLRQLINHYEYGSSLPVTNNEQSLSIASSSAANLRVLVDAGLEHPWLAALGERREQLITKASSETVSRDELLQTVAQTSRLESNVEYAALRHRLISFIDGPIHVKLCSDIANVSPSVPTLPSTLPASVNSWFQTVNPMVDWLTQPDRWHSYVDLIHPFLYGLMQVTEGLESLIFSPLNTSPDLTNLVHSLSTDLICSRPITSDSPLDHQLISTPLQIANQLLSPSAKKLLHGLASQRGQQASPGLVTGQLEFALASLIVDLNQLACIESPQSSPAPSGRLIANSLNAISRRWLRADREKRRQAELRSSLFVEADRRKQEVRRMMAASSDGNKPTDSDEPALLDANLLDEIEWRLRFPDQLQSDRRGSFGRDDQIQQTVQKIVAVDDWLKRTLDSHSTTWLPDPGQINHFVRRLLCLLLPPEASRLETATINESDRRRADCRWQVLLSSFQLASHFLLTPSHLANIGPDFDQPSALAGTNTIAAYLANHDARRECTGILLTDHHHRLDVYRDPIPLEAGSQLMTVVDAVEGRVRYLLSEWPGQPSLKRILTFIQRIESFSVTDPLMKYVTGLELIWQEIQEWEKVAARHVSLATQSEQVGRLLVDWRKLELSCWLGALDSAFANLSDKSLTLFFHLHALFLDTRNNGKKKKNKSDLAVERQQCAALIDLMEKGSIGEFDTRWQMIAALRQALAIWPPRLTGEQQCRVRRIVGNVAWYYSQFRPHVHSQLDQLRKPIEKELKGIVSVAKWGDFTRFWSVKTHVDQIKKSISKQIKKWEVSLQRPVQPHFESALDQQQPTATALSTPWRDNLLTVNRSSPSFDWLTSITAKFDLPTNVRRLPTLTKRMHHHLISFIASRDAPVVKSTNALTNYLSDWMATIDELQRGTTHLESSRPVVESRKEALDEAVAERIKQWQRKVTELQQGKRLALTRWFKTASLAASTTKSSEGDDLVDDDQQIDSSATDHMVSSSTLPSTINGSAEDVETISHLGLSYRRGQRNNCSDVAALLVQIPGDPWHHMMTTPTSLDKYSIKSIDTTTTQQPSAVCLRLARLLSLRSTFPKTPGSPSSSPEVVASLLADLGGPEAVDRLIGLADDLLYHCVASPLLTSCGSLASLSSKLTKLTNSFNASLDDWGASRDSSDDCPQSPRLTGGKALVDSIKKHSSAILALTNDFKCRWTCFEQAFSQTTDTPALTQSDVECLFGSSHWNSIIATSNSSPETLAHFQTEVASRLELSLDQLLSHARALDEINVFLPTNVFIDNAVALNNAVNKLVQELTSIRSDADAKLGSRAGHLIRTQVDPFVDLLNCQINSLQQLLTPVTTPNGRITPSLLDSQLIDQIDQLIQLILSSMQQLCRVDRVDASDQLQLFSSMADQLSESSSLQIRLRRMTNLLSQLTSCLDNSTSTNINFVRSTLPLLTGLCQSLHVRVEQLWTLLDVWTRLTEFVLRTTNRLLTNGLCRPEDVSLTSSSSKSISTNDDKSSTSDGQSNENDDGSGSCTSLSHAPQPGDDMGGVKDVSNQLECQEQIEGLANDDDRQGSDGPVDPSNDGIEMPDDDFGGLFDDQPGELEADEGDQKQEKNEELENRMDDTCGADDDVETAKEMWASDNEEESEDSSKPDSSSQQQGGVQNQGAKSNKAAEQSDERSSKLNENPDQQQDDNGEDDPGANDSNPPGNDDEIQPKSKRPRLDQQPVGDRQTCAGNDEDNLDKQTEDKQKSLSEATADDVMDTELADAQFEADHLASQDDGNDKNESDDSLLPHDDEPMNDEPGQDGEIDGGEEVQSSSNPPDQVDPEKGIESDDQAICEDLPSTTQMEIDESQPDNTQQLEQSDIQIMPSSGGGGTGESESAYDQMSGDSCPIPNDPSQSSNQQQFSGQPLDVGSQSEYEGSVNRQSVTASQQQPRRSGPPNKPASDRRRQDTRVDLAADQQIKRGAEILETDDDQQHEDGPSTTHTDSLLQHLSPSAQDDQFDDDQALDSATEQQRQAQRLLPTADQVKDVGLERQQDDAMQEDDRVPTTSQLESQSTEHTFPPTNKNKESTNVPGNDVTAPLESGETVATATVQLGPQSIIGTRLEAMTLDSDAVCNDDQLDIATVNNPHAKSSDLEDDPLSWSACSLRSGRLSRLLCESLRLVLEPTKAGRMRGDFRTGKRINMRKIIPYLASQFRKDKIWLRRSQPSQREYRILIAVDDSSSMSDNLCRQMTFNALAMVVNALTILEVGKIGVCSFGESVNILHDLRDTWLGDAGSRVLSQFTFNQPRTSLTQLLSTSCQLMQECRFGSSSSSSSSAPSQLLLILSDGIFSEDPANTKLKAAVQLARDRRLFPVCIILDDARKKHSIFELRRYTSQGKLQSYMDSFPLPYYLVLRDIAALPNLLCDALRQWFELESDSR